MLKLSVALLFAVGIAGAYFAFRKVPIRDPDGERSPYLKGGLFDDSVYYARYSGDGLMGSYHYKMIPNSKKETFEIVKIKMTMADLDDSTLKLAKVDNQYFISDSPLPFDPISEPLLRANRDRSKGPLIYVTEKRVFFLRQDTLIELPGVEPKTFWILGGSQAYGSQYAKDLKTVVYFYNDYEAGPAYAVIKDADAKTFEEVRLDYAKDRLRSYHKDKVDHSGPIVKIDDVFSKNDQLVFWYGSTIVGADAGTFTVIGGGFSRDKSSLFYQEGTVHGVDPNTFVDLTKPEGDGAPRAVYIRDEKAVHFYTGINGRFAEVAGADLKTFRHAGDAFAFDERQVFYEEKLLPGIESAGFEVLYKRFPMGFYAKNQRHVYLMNKDRKLTPIENADPSSFVAYSAEKVQRGRADAEDNRHYFLDGKIVREKK